MERPPIERAMSTDVVLDIVLSHLKGKDVLNCRRVSKFWNKAASSALRKRMTMTKKISEETDLLDLDVCIQQSWDFPFAGLNLNEPWRLSSAGTKMEFFTNHGGRFTRLYLSTWLWLGARLGFLAQLINHLPRLSILDAAPGCGDMKDVGLLDRAAEEVDGGILNLPSLRIFRTHCEMTQDILRQVCTAATSSLRIECLDARYQILSDLENVGKLKAVSVMNAHLSCRSEEFLLRLKKMLSTEMPALTTLELDLRECILQNGLIKLLISSRDTLKELSLAGIFPSQFSSDCPVLAKLTTLRLYLAEKSNEYVFQGSHGHKFPALKKLKLIIVNYKGEPLSASVNFSDGLFIVLSLTKIDLVGYVDKVGIEALARSFPNVIDIKLNYCSYDFEKWSWQRDPTDIWSVSAFKLLEKLRIWNYTVPPPTMISNKFKYLQGSINLKNIKMMNMDSFLTGITISICENLRKKNHQNLIDFSFNEILRGSPNILQLKNLKELIVSVDLSCGNKLKETPEEPPFISMVSIWYALQMMPNLDARFVYEPSSAPFYMKEEERDKAVAMLKAAFKHVQPFVELETFID